MGLFTIYSILTCSLRDRDHVDGFLEPEHGNHKLKYAADVTVRDCPQG